NLGPRLLLSLLLLLPQPALSLDLDLQLPDIGDPADAVMSPTAEKRLGRAFINSLRQRERFIDEAVFSDYIRDLGRDLVAKSGASPRDFSFHLIENQAVNAFAGPGGHIGVFTGLILTTESEDELASVMAHEIAHVTQKHLFRAFHRAQQMSTPAAVALLAAVLIGVAGGNADLGRAAITGVQAGMMQDQINYTRHNEEEADRVGIDLLAKSSFDPRAMPAFFGKMAKANQAYSTQLPEFLRTHPVTSNRIADAQGRAEKYPYKQRQDSIRYHLLRAWLKARSFNRPSKAVEHFQATLKSGRYRNKEAEEFGLAIALMQKREMAQAGQILRRLLEARPSSIEYRLSLAEVEQKQGKAAAALQLIDAGLAQRPSNRALLLGKVSLLEQTNKPAQAAKLLLELTTDHPQDPELFQRLSRAEARSGKESLAYSHMAEHYYLLGELKLAIHQLERALGGNPSDFEAAKMAARLRQIKQEDADLQRLKQR
ncbi:MAG: M48 family metallopeptidase, partial [Gammaproteobacteria bacterium]|nr:M48 family metallopeptidase [Gammaproteobacteria bacterium]